MAMLEGIRESLTPQLAALYLFVYLPAFAIVSSLLVWLAYSRFFHPLSGVPGPFLASATRLWYVHSMRQGSWDKVNRNLHARYGNVWCTVYCGKALTSSQALWYG